MLDVVDTGKKFYGAPFGCGTARFNVSGIHPKHKVPGQFTELPYNKEYVGEENRKLGPGMYHPHSKATDPRLLGPGWARAYEVECIAAMPHLLNKDQWLEKQNQKRKLGPGSYEPQGYYDHMTHKQCSARGMLSTRSARFPADKSWNCLPGPGTYGKGGIPQGVLEEKAKRSTSTKGMLDNTLGSRSLPLVGCRLGPGTYNFMNPTFELLDKVVSLRGPYDLFTAERGKPIIDGHFAAPKLSHLSPGEYDVKDSLDEWKERHRKYKGKFGKLTQYPFPPTERIFLSVIAQNPVEQGVPGPGAYDPGELSKPMNYKMPGFLSSAERVDRRALKFFTGNYNPVGPGRYDVQKFGDLQHRNGNQSSFKSRSNRPNHAMDKFRKERIRGKNIPVPERSVRQPAQGLPGETKPQHGYTFRRSSTVA